MPWPHHRHEGADAQTAAAVRLLNLVGALLPVEGKTVTNAVINLQNPGRETPRAELLADGGDKLLLIARWLAGAIIWNPPMAVGAAVQPIARVVWGLDQATMAGLGWGGVKWVGDGTKLDGVVGKVIIPGFMSPAIAMIKAMVGTHFPCSGVRSLVAGALPPQRLSLGSGRRRITDVDLGRHQRCPGDHGRHHAAPIASGEWSDTHSVPLWVKLACAVTIALGTYLGGWRIIRTMGKGLVEIEPPQGMSADMSSAAVILASSQLGFATARPPTSRPARFSAPALDAPGRRCAGQWPDGWRPAG